MTADLLTAALVEDIVASRELRVYVPTTPATEVAAEAARRLGSTGLAIARGFTSIDGGRDWATDVFTLLRRGWLGVTVSPAQLDAAGRTNLSGLGPPGRPNVALIGPRGLPENNDTPSPLWYLLPAHSPRNLVGRVDFVCGPAPSGAGQRTLLSAAGCFDLRDGAWRARWLAPGGAELITQAPAFPIEVAPGTPTRAMPAPEIQAALDDVDPDGLRRAEFGE